MALPLDPRVVLRAAVRAAQPPGEGPPATAADLVDVTRLHTADPNHRVPHLAFQPDELSSVPVLPIEEINSSYYLRMRVADETGELGPGGIWRIRSGTWHEATAGPEGAVVIDVFDPIRTDWDFPLVEPRPPRWPRGRSTGSTRG